MKDSEKKGSEIIEFQIWNSRADRFRRNVYDTLNVSDFFIGLNLIQPEPEPPKLPGAMALRRRSPVKKLSDLDKTLAKVAFRPLLPFVHTGWPHSVKK